MNELENIRRIAILFVRYCDQREKEGYIGSIEGMWEDFIQEVGTNDVLYCG